MKKKVKLAKQVPILINSWIKYFRNGELAIVLLLKPVTNIWMVEWTVRLINPRLYSLAFNGAHGWMINVRQC